MTTTTTDPIVQTRSGRLRGVRHDDHYAFLGVRYGADTADYRFKPPVAEPAWEGVRDATSYGDRCPQVNGEHGPIYGCFDDPVPMSEDCLNINIYTPALDDAKRPVMVWLHGGGFMIGSGSIECYQGKGLAAQDDVVQVSVTHRLNAFGFMYLADELGPDYAKSGNVGLLDIVLALEWVRDNIAAFGGDPDRVMIFGESGGGGKVSALMAMPAAKGLFHRACIQSGSMLSGSPPEANKVQGKTLFDALGIAPAEAAKLLELSVDEMVAGLTKAFPTMGGFGPVVDGEVLHKVPFYPEAPAESSDVPLMVGTTQTEMSGLLGGLDPSLFDLTWEDLPARIGFAFGMFGRVSEYSPADPVALVQKAREIRPDVSPGRMFFELTGFGIFHYNAMGQVERKVAQGRAPTFVYMVNYESPIDGGKWGSPHTIDIPFCMRTQQECHSLLGDDLTDANKLADAMAPAWVAFARTGNPSTPARAWPAYDTDSRPTMVFDVKSRVEQDPWGDLRKLMLATKAA